MSKGLNSLDEIVIHLYPIYAGSKQALENFRNIKKELEALEIIKKRFTIQFIKSEFLPNYYGIMQIGINPIYIKTKEEFDLLKEVLS